MNTTSTRAFLSGAIAVVSVLLCSGCATSVPAAAPVETTPAAAHAINDAGQRFYLSTASTEGGGAVDWLSSNPILISFVDVGAELKLGVNGPCNALTYSIGVDNEDPLTWTVLDGPAMTFVGCLGVNSEREEWLRAVLEGENTRVTQTAETVQISSGPVTIDAELCQEGIGEQGNSLPGCPLTGMGAAEN